MAGYSSMSMRRAGGVNIIHLSANLASYLSMSLPLSMGLMISLLLGSWAIRLSLVLPSMIKASLQPVPIPLFMFIPQRRQLGHTKPPRPKDKRTDRRGRHPLKGLGNNHKIRHKDRLQRGLYHRRQDQGQPNSPRPQKRRGHQTGTKGEGHKKVRSDLCG